MSNPEHVGTTYNLPVVLETSSTSQSIVTDIKKQYIVQHNAINSVGTAVLTPVALAFNTMVANLISGASKAILIEGTPMIIGPGIEEIAYMASTGDPTITISPMAGD